MMFQMGISKYQFFMKYLSGFKLKIDWLQNRNKSHIFDASEKDTDAQPAW